GPAFDPDVRLIAIDPDPALVNRARTEKGRQLMFGCVADSASAADTLLARADDRDPRKSDWHTEARSALDNRPAVWRSVISQTQGRLHAAELFRALRPFVERDPDTVLIC